MSFTPYPKNSDFIILKGVPIENDYKHTLYFTDISTQTNTFQGFQKASTVDRDGHTVNFWLTAQSYQRIDNGIVRAGIEADLLMDCNYIMFRNTSYGSKWFYAFIDNITYVNDHTSEIHYTLDVMQTWYFDYEIEPCYVEREHSLTDNYGENFIDEGLETGSYIVRGTQSYLYGFNPYTGAGTQWYIMVEYVPNKDSNGNAYVISTDGASQALYVSDPHSGFQMIREYPTFETFNGCPCAYTFVVFPINQASATDFQNTALSLQGIIQALVDYSCSVISIKVVPDQIIRDYGLILSSGVASWTQTPAPHDMTFSQNAGFKKLDFDSTNYVPKNKKLYQYPYRQILASNNQGNTAVYKWEDFLRVSSTDSYISHFEVYTTICPDANMHLVPVGYRMRAGEDWECGLEVGGFPTVAWSEDSFSRWWNVNAEKWTFSLLSTTLTSLIGYQGARYFGELGIAHNEGVGNALLNRGNYMGASNFFHGAEIARGKEAVGVASSLINGASQIGQLLAARSSAKATPDEMHGQTQSQSIIMREGRYGFTLYDMQITGEYAETIDNYFSMFGYATKKVKQPNICRPYNQIRPYWNYIQTKGCIIRPANGKGLNGADEAKICSIYDNGITFWRTTDVGNYNRDNSPVI